jgi:cytochrome P450
MMGLLGQHPEWAQRASHEVDQVLGSRLAAARDVSQLALCQGIWLEAMRLYPPAWMIGRRCLRPTHIGQEPIPAGSIMSLSQWVTHRDPQIYALPEQFCPQRWVGQGPPRLAYFPFGAGPRLCIGETFARLEGVLILASLLQRFRFRALGPELPRPIPRVTLEPRGGLPLLIEAR